MNSSKYELSKTYQYRKVMKPMLERKRRARINKCLDELKDLIAECMQQQSGDPSVKLEKADILELTVQHLRKIKSTKSTETLKEMNSFRTGYIQAANEVSRCLANLPKVDIGLGTKVMTHLGIRLNELVPVPQQTVIHSSKPNTPLNVYCGSETSISQQSATMLSPVSSGYGSDSDFSSSSSSSSSGLLLKVSVSSSVKSENSVWRPW